MFKFLDKLTSAFLPRYVQRENRISSFGSVAVGTRAMRSLQSGSRRSIGSDVCIPGLEYAVFTALRKTTLHPSVLISINQSKSYLPYLSHNVGLRFSQERWMPKHRANCKSYSKMQGVFFVTTNILMYLLPSLLEHWALKGTDGIAKAPG